MQKYRWSQAEVRKAWIRLKGEHYEEFRLILADLLWNTVVTKFKTEQPTKHDLDLQDVNTMLGETIAKIRDKEIKDAELKGWQEGKKECAWKLLKIGLTIETIITATGLSQEDILTLNTETADA